MSSSLVQNLQTEHASIVNLLDDVRKLGIASPEAKSKLFKAKTLIISHLQKEDAQLYPKLQQNPETATIAKMFSSEMAELSKAVIAFFEKYEGTESDMDFARDVGRIVGTLKLRISKEESQLYPAYDRLEAAA